MDRGLYMLDTQSLYRTLYSNMGAQNWWPAESKIEVILGAILVQNTNWRNAEYALQNLKEETAFDPECILTFVLEQLQTIIKSCCLYKNIYITILIVLYWINRFDIYL